MREVMTAVAPGLMAQAGYGARSGRWPGRRVCGVVSVCVVVVGEGGGHSMSYQGASLHGHVNAVINRKRWFVIVWSAALVGPSGSLRPRCASALAFSKKEKHEIGAHTVGGCGHLLSPPSDPRPL